MSTRTALVLVAGALQQLQAGDSLANVVAGFSAPGGTITVGGVSFANSNGITFGMNGSTLTASVAAGAAAGIGAASAGTQQQTSGTLVFANSNGLTFGMSASSQITASVSTVVFSNSNGVTFGLNASTLTASVSSVVFSNSNGISFGLNAATLTASYASQAFSAGTQSGSSATLVFADSNGISWGLSGSSQITAKLPSVRFWESPVGAALVANAAATNSAAVNLRFSAC